jgi:hypothetical protein
MNLIAHQFITDWRHFRLWVAAVWLCFAAQLALPLANTSYRLDEPLMLLQIVVAVFLVNRLIQADAVAGTTAAWLTRPLRRRHLFWAKLGFIFYCLILPRLAAQSVYCLSRGFSADLWMGSIAGILLYSLAVAAGAAALSALTPNMPRFFLAAGTGFVSVILCLAFLEATSQGRVVVRGESGDNSAEAASLALFAAAAAFAWGCQTLARRRALGIVVFCAGGLGMPVVDDYWRVDFLKPRQTLVAPHPVQVSAPGSEAAAPGSQRLWNVFRVDNMPTRQLAVVEGIRAQFQPDEASNVADLRPFWPRPWQYLRALPEDSAQAREYYQIIRGWFPPETLWFGGDTGPFGSGIPPLLPPPGLFYGETGLLTGTMDMDLFEVVKAGELPLRPATICPQPGQRVSIRRVAPDFNGIRIDLEESVAAPMFSRLPYRDDLEIGGPTLFTYVLYHAESGEACSAQFSQSPMFPNAMSDEFHRSFNLTFSYPQLRQRLAGVSLQDWLREARLCVFVPVYNGTFKAPFQQEHYTLTNVWDSPQQDASREGLAAIKNLTLPANPTDAQIAAYLDAIFLHLPGAWDSGAEGNIILGKIAAIGTNGLPELLRRLPADGAVETAFILPAVARLAGRGHLPELREALRRDPDLADIFVKNNWEDDARDILAGQLGDHRIALPAAALLIMARAHNAADYPGLAWHFVRLSSGQEEVIAELRQCPGFDLAAALSEAWKRAQLGIIPKNGLAAAAAAEGLPGAMNSAVMLMETASGNDRRRLAARLAALTSYDGPPEKAGDWLSANLVRLRYDPPTRSWTVGASAEP